MNFDELKFKAEEIPSDYGPLARRAHMATELNRILAEKLTPLLTELHELRKLKEEVERAPEIFGQGLEKRIWTRTPQIHSDNNGHICEASKYKARLVCIKPIKE